MKATAFIFLLLTVVAFGSAVPTPQIDNGVELRKSEHFLKKIRRAVKKGFRKVRRGIKKGARRVSRRVRRVGRGIRRRTRRAGRRISRGVRRFGRNIRRGVKKTGRAIKKGAKKAGRAIKKILKNYRVECKVECIGGGKCRRNCRVVRKDRVHRLATRK